MKHSQQQYSNHHQIQHPDRKKALQNNAFSNAIARYNQWRPDLGLSPWRKTGSPKQCLPRPLPGTANEGQTLRFHPEHHGSVLSTTRTLSTCVATPSCQRRCCNSPTPDTQENLCLESSTQPNLHSASKSLWSRHHDFLRYLSISWKSI